MQKTPPPSSPDRVQGSLCPFFCSICANNLEFTINPGFNWVCVSETGLRGDKDGLNSSKLKIRGALREKVSRQLIPTQ